MSKTLENLQAAFAGESQANRKYLAFAKKADDEGFPQAARLFRAAAEAETIHAHAHLRVMGGIKSTRENLEAAIGGETHEFTEMYPEMLTDAKNEDNKGAERSFDNANQVEKIHAALYEKVLDNLGKNKSAVYYVCQVCGNTVENEAPGTCPICGAPASKFKKVE
jgi:rubrerythrin